MSVERLHYDYREGQSPGGRLPICANLTGEIERNLSVNVVFHAGAAKRELPMQQYDQCVETVSHSLPCAVVFDPDNARDGDVNENIRPIVFQVPQGSTRKDCHPVCTACSQVEIRNDFIVEEKFETFSLSLSHSDPAVTTTSEIITVTIEDEDSQLNSLT